MDLISEWRKEMWYQWLESGRLIEVTSTAKKHNIKVRTVLTAGLFDELMPYQEDAVHGIGREERISDLINSFRREVASSRGGTWSHDYCEFEVSFRSRSNNADGNIIQLHRTVDKSVTVIAGRLSDDNGNPALVFALKNPKKLPAA